MSFLTLDIETTPIQYSNTKLPEPFAVCLFDGTDYKIWWGIDCIDDSLATIKTLKSKIYAHNGGRFDFLYYTHHADKIYMGPFQRILSMQIHSAKLIDSYPLIRSPLSELDKSEIDMKKFKPQHREQHKAEITAYLKNDCKILWEYLRDWERDFGKIHRSIGSAARQICKQKSLWITQPFTLAQDKKFRPWFFSGRVENFYYIRHRPVFNAHYYDINSAYPFAMLAHHPISPERRLLKKSEFWEVYDHEKRFFLLRIRAYSYGQYPFRHQNEFGTEILYPRDGAIREYQITSWEFQHALSLFGDTIDEILEVWEFPVTVSFKEYVLPLYQRKIEASNPNQRLSSKLLLNSLFGKFGQNPNNWKNFHAVNRGLLFKGEFAYSLASESHDVYKRPLSQKEVRMHLSNVVTATSISGLVRARMLGILQTETVRSQILYCDTDCIITPNEINLPVSLKLGDFKHLKIDELWIESKRRYCFRIGDVWHTKSAGEHLTHKQIIALCQNKSIYLKTLPGIDRHRKKR